MADPNENLPETRASFQYLFAAKEYFSGNRLP